MPGKHKLQSPGALVLLALLAALFAVMCVDSLPVLWRVVKNAGNEDSLTRYFSQYGMKGVPILLSLQILCVILTVIPDSPVQVLAGICYGLWGGMGIALAGYLLGNLLVFVAVRLFRRGFPRLTLPGHKHRHPKKRHAVSLQSLRQAENPGRLALLLYLIPGIPSGPLPYLFAGSRISLARYLLCMALGSLPSLFVTTLIGKLIDEARYTAAIVLALAYGAVLLAAIMFSKSIFKKMGLGTKNRVQ